MIWFPLIGTRTLTNCSPRGRAASAPGASLALALVLAACPLAAQETRWYTSNADFMELREIPERLEEGFVLARDEAQTPGAPVTLSLYRDGVAVGRREVTFDAGVTASVREFDAEGVERFTEVYRYRPDGTLRSVTRCDADGTCLAVKYSVAAEEILEDDARSEIRRYDEQLRPVAVDRSGQNGVASEVRRYDETGLTETVETRGPRTETVAYREGRRASRTVTEAGRVVELEEFTYDDQGRLIRVERETRRERLVEETLFAADGSSRTRVTADDELLRETVRFPDGSTEELRYRDGELFIKVFLENDRRVREELYRDGQLIEVREFPDEAGR